ncbi:MAG: elongation factor Ts [Parcubacteria group bacterium]|nr:elongation factor Ts [Parcubacteria group bacterium]
MISVNDISRLREETQAPVMECKKALEEAKGDFEKAKLILKKKGEMRAEKKQANDTRSGIIDSYIHANNKVGVIIELRCETDSVANNPDFKLLAHDLAMHIAAMEPQFISRESIAPEMIEQKKKEYSKEFEETNKPQEIIDKIIQGKLDKEFQETCLLDQIFIKDETKKIGDLLKEATAKFGEKIEVAHFCRLQI